MHIDIERICDLPAAEERDWFSGVAGKPWLPVLGCAMRSREDEASGRYPSPKLTRDMRPSADVAKRGNVAAPPQP